MLRAIIFDFDGVLVDSEPLIYEITRQMAAKEGWTLGREEYFRDYLALDDRGITEHLYRSHRRPLDEARRDELVDWKFHAYAAAIRDGLPALPGATEFVNEAAKQYPLAIASGSLRSEVEHLLTKIGLRDKFPLLVTAEDTTHGKPDPEIYVKAVAGLNRFPVFKDAQLQAAECLAIEDALGGIRAAQAAGMKCLAVVNSRPASELARADFVVRELAEINLAELRRAFE